MCSLVVKGGASTFPKALAHFKAPQHLLAAAPIDVDGLRLADAVRPAHRLQVVLRVPAIVASSKHRQTLFIYLSGGCSLALSC